MLKKRVKKRSNEWYLHFNSREVVFLTCISTSMSCLDFRKEILFFRPNQNKTKQKFYFDCNTFKRDYHENAHFKWRHQSFFSVLYFCSLNLSTSFFQIFFVIKSALSRNNTDLRVSHFLLRKKSRQMSINKCMV